MSRSGFIRTIGILLCFLIFVLSPVSPSVEIITQGLPPTKGFHLSIETLPNSNVIFILTGEIDAYDDVWVNPDTEVDWYYNVNGSGPHLLGVECYTPSYPMCPELNLNVSENLAQVKARTKLTKGIIENGSVLFNFSDGTYRIPVPEILPYLWDKSWVEHLWGYKLNGNLVFFPRIIIEIKGASARYQNCFIENSSVPVIYLTQKYNVTYYVKTSWKRLEVKSELTGQRELLQLLKKPLYVFFYNGTFKAFKVGKIDFGYSTVLTASNDTTSVFIRPRFYYSNMAPPFASANATHSRTINITSCRQDKYEFWMLALILFVSIIACLLRRKQKNR